MKLRVANFVTRLPVLALMAVCLEIGAGVAAAQAQTDSGAVDKPVPARSPAPGASPAGAKVNKKPKKGQPAEAATPTPIPFLLGQGMPASDLLIPETNELGAVLSQLKAAKATRIDNEHVEMKEMKMDLNHPDGKEDFHVILPTSIFNLRTRIISSNEPVTVQTQDFELTGEGMEFNTVDRSGKLIGKVRMLIHNFKQALGQTEPTPKPE